MMGKSLTTRFEYFLRDLRSRRMFYAMKRYCGGHVLDIGGWDFYLTAKRRGIPCTRWTTLEYVETHALSLDDEKYTLVHGDGCAMEFPDETFDTVLNIQVLEHVFEPIRMVQETARVLKKGGFAIFVIPQTAVVHGEPHHYYNFTPFWTREALLRSGLEVVEEHPMGGMWSSMASHLFFLLFSTFRRRFKSPTGRRRHLLFYLLFPLMVLYVCANLPVCMFLSLGDLTEEPNNNLVVARKPEA